MNEDFILALDELEKDKNIDKEVILEALEKARISNANEIISETVKKSETPSYVDALFPIED